MKTNRETRFVNMQKVVEEIGVHHALQLYLRAKEAEKVLAEYRALKTNLGNYADVFLRSLAEERGLVETSRRTLAK